MQKFYVLVVIAMWGTLLFPSMALGVMSSANYTIFADSIDAGGVLSASGTYSLEDTIGESPVGSVSGGAYQVIGGYQAMDWSVLAITVNPSTINLGTLDVATVASSSAVVLVTAAASNGYVLSVGSVGGTSLTSVSDGTVTAGNEEYGVAVSGPDAAFVDDQAIVNGLNIASANTSVTNAQSVLTFKAAISSGSIPGSRSQSVTLAASTNI